MNPDQKKRRIEAVVRSQKKTIYEKKHYCDKCKKAWSSIYGLTQHLKSNRHGAPYNCKECDYITNHRSRLKIHLRIHIEKII